MNETQTSFIERLTQSLQNPHIDFHEKYLLIRNQQGKETKYLSAGVCMPIFSEADRFYFQLIKRSAKVSQPGDLSFPGGMLNPIQDYPLRYMITSGIIPVIRRNRFLAVKQYPPHNMRAMTLFLANALREAWEEVGMNPYHLVYLGSLPTYTLKTFHRVIFPSVCFVTGQQARYRLNEEVDRIVNLPLTICFDESNYFQLIIEMPAGSPEPVEKFPCLLFKDESGYEHILWGATFALVMGLLEVVYDFHIPAIPDEKSIKKTLLPNYCEKLTKLVSWH